MIVHRFAQWVTRLLSPLRARLRSMLALNREEVLSSVHTPLPAPTRSAGRFPTTHWLAAARRLRPPRPAPAIRPPSSRQATSSHLISATGTGREHVVVSRPRPEAIDPGVPMQPAQPTPPTQPLRPKPTPPARSSDREEHAFRQRLLSLRRLVRLGIYDEGFQKDAVPEQYQHSLGQDEPRARDQQEFDAS